MCDDNGIVDADGVLGSVVLWCCEWRRLRGRVDKGREGNCRFETRLQVEGVEELTRIATMVCGGYHMGGVLSYARDVVDDFHRDGMFWVTWVLFLTAIM
jgi:hypothetical protein